MNSAGFWKVLAGIFFGVMFTFVVMASTPRTPETSIPLFLVGVLGIWIAGFSTGIALAYEEK